MASTFYFISHKSQVKAADQEAAMRAAGYEPKAYEVLASFDDINHDVCANIVVYNYSVMAPSLIGVAKILARLEHHYIELHVLKPENGLTPEELMKAAKAEQEIIGANVKHWHSDAKKAGKKVTRHSLPEDIVEQIYRLHDSEGLGYAAIAKQLGLSRQAVYGRLKRRGAKE